MWQSVEDLIIEKLEEHIMEKPVRHLSLHFDGVAVDEERVDADEDFAQQCQDVISFKCGFDILLRRKHHVTFLEAIKAGADQYRTLEFGQNMKVLLDDGNCIPLAIAHLRNIDDISADFVPAPGVQNLTASIEKCRTYESCLPLLAGKSLHGRLGVDLSSRGLYLVHNEGRGHAHCFAVSIDDNKKCQVYDQNQCWTCSLHELLQWSVGAVDRRSICVFTIPDSKDDQNAALLRLKAAS